MFRAERPKGACGSPREAYQLPDHQGETMKPAILIGVLGLVVTQPVSAQTAYQLQMQATAEYDRCLSAAIAAHQSTSQCQAPPSAPAATEQYQQTDAQAVQQRQYDTQAQRERQYCANAVVYSRQPGLVGDLARGRLNVCIAEGLVASPPPPTTQSTFVQCRPVGGGNVICDTTTQ